MDGGNMVTLLSGIALAAAAIAGIMPILAAGNVLGYFRFGVQTLTTSSRALPSRKEVWGSVYDSATKRPLAFARVRLIGKDSRVLEERVADHEGRYAFLTTPASIMASDVSVRIEAEYAGYAFPSHAQSSSADTFLYGNLYYGGLMRIDTTAVVNADIPMDAVAGKPVVEKVLRAPSVGVGLATAAMADMAFWIGLIAVPLAYVFQPNPFTLGFVFLYLGTVSMRVFGIAERPYGIVIDTASGYAMPYALITVRRMDGERVAHAVTDNRGRYVLAVQKGEYVVTVRTPANVQPPRTISESVKTKQGWLTRELKL